MADGIQALLHTVPDKMRLFTRYIHSVDTVDDVYTISLLHAVDAL